MVEVKKAENKMNVTFSREYSLRNVIGFFSVSMFLFSKLSIIIEIYLQIFLLKQFKKNTNKRVLVQFYSTFQGKVCLFNY